MTVVSRPMEIVRKFSTNEISTDRIELVQGFGRNRRSVGYVFRPSNADDVEEVFDLARRTGLTIGLRGAGMSYGDAAQNNEEVVVDLTGLRRVVAWNCHTGVVTVEPGVTVETLWSTVLPDGWWPPVVPGTMYPTVGGCVAMNVHGKNNFRVGPIGDHVLSFDFLTPNGNRLTVSRASNPDLFYAAIGGFGMLGCFVSITLQMKRVYSGLLDVVGLASHGLDESMRRFEEHCDNVDYMVGWIDGTAGGGRNGRGVLHYARHLSADEDPDPTRSLLLEHQHVPDVLFGFVPTAFMWRMLRPLVNNAGMRFVNALRYTSGRLFDGAGRRFRQSLVAYSFLLDYIPDWRRAYGKGGLIQYQSFVPAGIASDVFAEQLKIASRAGYPPFLSVLKRHRKDEFLITHGVDGYSLALDFRVRRGRRDDLFRLARRLDEIVLQGGGRFYFAKDSTLTPEAARTFLGADILSRFNTLREQCDPQSILRTDLYSRLFADESG